MLTNLKEWFLKVFLVNYIKDFLQRLKGYRMFLGIVLTLFQIAAQIVASPETKSILEVLIKAFADVTAGQLDPSEITIVATSLYAIWGAIMKIVKAAKQVPQVPTVLIKKV